MICKVCENSLISTWGGWSCISCEQYTANMSYDNMIESETVCVSNYYLVFFPIHKEANVVEKSEENNRIIKTFPIDELTHEEAIKWLEKLKTYVIFQ
jgi:hypothetical protein